jgi:hypothetical protein
MNMPVVRRAPDGKLLAGSILNPAGRPANTIQQVREILGQHKEELVDTLLELVRSDDDAIRLAAVKEAFDRLLGKAVQSTDTANASIENNIQMLYLAAVQRANQQPPPIDVTPAPDARNSATEW